VLKHGYFAGCHTASHVRRSSATPRRLLCVSSPVANVSDSQSPRRPAAEPVVTPATDTELFPWLDEQHEVAPPVHRLGTAVSNKPPTMLSTVSPRPPPGSGFLDSLSVCILLQHQSSNCVSWSLTSLFASDSVC